MKYHEAANAFPLMDAKRFDELKADIKQHGLRQPITLYNGAVLDGRNRLTACKELGIEPTTKVFEGDPWAYVWSLNGQRRDLSQERRAQIGRECIENSGTFKAKAAEIAAAANEKRSQAALGNQNAAKDRPKNSGSTNRTPTEKNPGRKAEAAALGVNEGAYAKAVALKQKRPDLAEKVCTGELTPAAARKQAKKDAKPKDISELYDDTVELKDEPSKKRLDFLIKHLLKAEELCFPGIKELESFRGRLNTIRRQVADLREKHHG